MNGYGNKDDDVIKMTREGADEIMAESHQSVRNTCVATLPTPGVKGSMIGVVGPASVHCKASLICSFYLRIGSMYICLIRSVLEIHSACCWDVKQLRYKVPPFPTAHWLLSPRVAMTDVSLGSDGFHSR